MWEEKKANEPQLIKNKFDPANLGMRELNDESVVSDDVTEG